jgi:hypothetical protein
MSAALAGGERLRATLTDRTYRVLAPRDGECRSFRAPVDRIQDDIDAGRIEVIDA